MVIRVMPRQPHSSKVGVLRSMTVCSPDRFLTVIYATTREPSHGRLIANTARLHCTHAGVSLSPLEAVWRGVVV